MRNCIKHRKNTRERCNLLAVILLVLKPLILTAMNNTALRVKVLHHSLQSECNDRKNEGGHQTGPRAVDEGDACLGRNSFGHWDANKL